MQKGLAEPRFRREGLSARHAGRASTAGYLPIPVWQRYNGTEIESPYMYQTPQLWDPYKQSILKGDTPVIGQDIFFAMTATSFTSYEARDVPTPSNVSSAQANSSEFFGAGNQMEVDQFLLAQPRPLQGRDRFSAVTWDLHIQPVYNINYTRVEENGVLSVDPRREQLAIRQQRPRHQ